MEHEDECYYDDWDIEHSYAPDDSELWWLDLELKKAIARQGPQYSEYKSCMWE